MSEYKVSDQDLVDKLNAIDDIRHHLTQLAGNDQLFLDTLMSELPQFVVVGAQSAGKSSVLKRISNNSIRLPEAATVCTKVPTILKLRRLEEEKNIQVCVIGPSGQIKEQELPNQDHASVTQAIANAQEHAISFNPDKLFAEDYSIEVKITKKSLPNVTLIDLPGFTNASDECTKIVNEMVEKQVGRPGSLVLHVCKSDQDYDTIIGNDFLRKIDKDKILVLTHTDRLNNFEPKEQKARLDATIKSTKDPRYAIIGNHEGTFEEESELLRNHVSIAARPDIHKGTASLNQQIEKNIALHLEKQVPIAIENLENEKIKTEKRLEIIKEKDPTTVIQESVQLIKNKLLDNQKDIENHLRIIQEEQPKQIINLDIYELTDNWKYVNINTTNCKYLKENFSIFYYSDGFNLDIVNRTKIEKKIKLLDDKFSKFDGNSDQFIFDCVYGKNQIDKQQMNQGPIDKIKELSTVRGMRNIQMQDKQPILIHFAEKLAEKQTIINKNNLQETQSYLKKEFVKCFEVGIDSLSSIAIKKLIKSFQVKYDELQDETFIILNSIKEFNEGSMVQSVSEPKLIEKMNFFSTPDKPLDGDEEYFNILNEIETQLRVQTKTIAEISQKHIILKMYVKGKELVHNVIKDEMSKVVKQVNDPEDIKSEREALRIRSKILDECVKIIRNI